MTVSANIIDSKYCLLSVTTVYRQYVHVHCLLTVCALFIDSKYSLLSVSTVYYQ